MENHPNKILYVGAGCHIEPVRHFPKTKLFVFIDSQPRSEFDSECPKFNSQFHNPQFLTNLIESCRHYGFNIESYYTIDKKYYKKIISKTWYYMSWFYKPPSNVNPAMLVFHNKRTRQKIIYYVSTNIKFNMNNILENDISTCDGIIISGYLPEAEILQHFSRTKIFFGYTNTSYNVDTKSSQIKDNNIIYFLHNCICNTQYFFTDFYVVYEDSGTIKKCNNFKHFLETVDQYHYQINQRILEEDTNSSDSIC